MKNVVLLCAAGMSTSILVKKMEKAAEEMGYKCKIHAHSIASAQEVGTDADIILLGPQVRFQKDKLKEQFPGKPVEVIDMKDYGMMNGKKVITWVKNLIG